jgi:hypothetical protein
VVVVKELQSRHLENAARQLGYGRLVPELAHTGKWPPCNQLKREFSRTLTKSGGAGRESEECLLGRPIDETDDAPGVEVKIDTLISRGVLCLRFRTSSLTMFCHRSRLANRDFVGQLSVARIRLYGSC